MGLVIGAVTGAAIGAAADGLRNAGVAVARTGRSIHDHVPDLHAAEIAGKAQETAQRVAQSPMGEATKHAGRAIAVTAREGERRAEKFAQDHLAHSHEPGTERDH
ncbi:hypothetical protein [Rhodococcus maanshanensis]|uniref:Uncharacterized protein n=1 Tax=Rhodococcus maanshanensis TaxID=183556 RepID=A0A1H7LRV1_9NOCA|nr:hypothetical protein [Rhodococcus maanshanensis]SEL01185.1 hypothetical protein SAMN05444583_105122 [Rhodococcus maanshanensis]